MNAIVSNEKFISKERTVLTIIVRTIVVVLESIFALQIIFFDKNFALVIFIIFNNVILSLLEHDNSVSTTSIVRRAHRVYQSQQQNTLAQFNLLYSTFEYDKDYFKNIIKKKKI